MNFQSKKDDLLVSELKMLVKQERETTTEILHYLKEVESRRIYLERGYSSLFDWVVKELGYSGGAAHRRIQSMRLLKSLPELEEKISSGELSLCVAAQAQSFFRKEELSPAKQREIAQTLVGTSSRECERKLAAIAPEARPREKLRAISGTETSVQFVASQALLEKLERLKNLLAHQNPEGSLEGLIEQLADIALKKLEKSTSNVGNKAPSKITPQTRHIPTAIKRAVWNRDQGRCTYKDSKTQRFCHSTYAIQYEHLKPYSHGGEHTPENLTLRCRAHNLHSAEKMGLLKPA